MRKSVYVHHVCAMWAPEVYHDPETDELRYVMSAYLRSRGLTCSVCGENGASVGCYVPECERAFHYCCLCGTPPPSASNTENDGPCVRHDDCYAAFYLARAARANYDIFMQQMKADAALGTFLADRAAAVDAALGGHPQQGTDCPKYSHCALICLPLIRCPSYN